MRYLLGFSGTVTTIVAVAVIGLTATLTAPAQVSKMLEHVTSGGMGAAPPITPEFIRRCGEFQAKLAENPKTENTETGDAPDGGWTLDFEMGLREHVELRPHIDSMDWQEWPSRGGARWVGMITCSLHDTPMGLGRRENGNPPLSERAMVETAKISPTAPIPGIFVRGVMPGSPASEAGIQPGDILLEAIAREETMEENGKEGSTGDDRWVPLTPWRWPGWLWTNRDSLITIRLVHGGELIEATLRPREFRDLPIFPVIWGHPDQPLGRLTVGVRPDGTVENTWSFRRPDGIVGFVLHWKNPSQPTANMTVMGGDGSLYRITEPADLEKLPSECRLCARTLWNGGHAEPARQWTIPAMPGQEPGKMPISYAELARRRGLSPSWLVSQAKVEGVDPDQIGPDRPAMERGGTGGPPGGMPPGGMRPGDGTGPDGVRLGPPNRSGSPGDVSELQENVIRGLGRGAGGGYGQSGGRRVQINAMALGAAGISPGMGGSGSGFGNGPGNRLVLPVTNTETESLRRELRELRDAERRSQESIAELTRAVTELTLAIEEMKQSK